MVLPHMVYAFLTELLIEESGGRNVLRNADAHVDYCVKELAARRFITQQFHRGTYSLRTIARPSDLPRIQVARNRGKYDHLSPTYVPSRKGFWQGLLGRLAA